MPETFVPLISARTQSGGSSFTSLTARSVSVPTAKGATGATDPATPCVNKPVITLQRTGEVVTSIRVQCGCGQVIDLACVY